jgi:hypothetical protein
MRIVPHDVPVLAGSGLRFIGVDDQIMRPFAHLLGHEGPLEAGREAGAAAPPQAGGLDLVDDGVAPAGDDVARPVPGAALHCPFQAPVVEPVKVLENTVLVSEHC